jgi:hypothetical protein
VDPTPPQPVIASPQFGGNASRQVAVVGSVVDTSVDRRFASYDVIVRKTGDTRPLANVVIKDTTLLVVSDTLAVWDTIAATDPPQDGAYEIELRVRDNLGLMGVARVTFELDNHAPFDSVTVPADLDQRGGEVFTRSGEMRLYVPPYGFEKTTRIDAIELSEPLQGAVPSGARFSGLGDSLVWSNPLKKWAVLAFRVPQAFRIAHQESLVISRLDGGNWVPVGGTLDHSSWWVTMPIQDPGCYALFLGPPTHPDESRGLLGEVAITPRIFSPLGGFGGTNVARISFSLPREGSVSVRVYNRAGGLVKEVARDRSMQAGLNSIEWDGRTNDGAIARDGLYVISVEASGIPQKRKTVVLTR